MAGVAAAAAFLAGAGTALGAADWHGIPTLNSSGVRFQEGEYRFHPPLQNDGAFEWKGRLKDKAQNDGHNVYMQVRVEGYDWVRYEGRQGQTVFMHHSEVAGGQLYTDDAYLRACRNKGSLRPDNCSPTKHYLVRRGS
ncbi:hypothetical protein NFX46_33325 [Streptomyces phaeoluteigriseus]|uniref:Beta/gamma crystallin 'Greek key' domain-containing protein n=1 Tax=Streptomyces phaeoluteigriseus TaxID=114686 RepID=A0ABY4ZGJ2_9ACTN|nr:hypothetical protein [Streptomyces phaeoluteigriseus]USQ88199.1 hypothetical protein NFX46_33325 [Streptomyces phaeoluteigriseus]